MFLLSFWSFWVLLRAKTNLSLRKKARRGAEVDRLYGRARETAWIRFLVGRLEGVVGRRPKLCGVRFQLDSFYLLPDCQISFKIKVGWVGWPLRITHAHASGKKNQPKKNREKKKEKCATPPAGPDLLHWPTLLKLLHLFLSLGATRAQPPLSEQVHYFI